MVSVTRFRPELLQSPRTFYPRELGELSRENHAGWASPKSGVCPFHSSTNKRRHKSSAFRVNLQSGGFVCLSCGTKGRDVLAFLMARDGVDFKTAAQRLGAWDGRGRTYKPPKIAVRFLVVDFTVDGVRYRAEVRDEPRTGRQRLWRSYAEARDRLRELRRGEPEHVRDEAEICWGIMASTWELLQEEVEQ